jgi:hypothetical protein
MDQTLRQEPFGGQHLLLPLKSPAHVTVTTMPLLYRTLKKIHGVRFGRMHHYWFAPILSKLQSSHSRKSQDFICANLGFGGYLIFS